jgi:hypothetical protein
MRFMFLFISFSSLWNIYRSFRCCPLIQNPYPLQMADRSLDSLSTTEEFDARLVISCACFPWKNWTIFRQFLRFHHPNLPLRRLVMIAFSLCNIP